jgi:hypothetical protein
MKKTSAVLLTIIVATVALTGCLGRVEDEDLDVPADLTSGLLELELYPVSTIGVSGLGPFCREIYECGCPLLSPDDPAWCRDEVWHYSEETCENMLRNVVPECFPG